MFFLISTPLQDILGVALLCQEDAFFCLPDVNAQKPDWLVRTEPLWWAYVPFFLDSLEASLDYSFFAQDEEIVYIDEHDSFHLLLQFVTSDDDLPNIWV